MAGGYAIPEVGEEAGWPDVGFMALMYRGLGPIRRIEELQPRIVQSWNSMWLGNPASGPQSIEPWPHQKILGASNPGGSGEMAGQKVKGVGTASPGPIRKA